MKFKYPYGSTPLNPDEIEGLIPIHITTQEQLNEWEANNILEAENWIFSKTNLDVFDIIFCCKLHKIMFNKTWKWAGKFRKSDKNIGVFWEQIGVQLKMLLDDTKYQISNNIYLLDEIAMRFHHRLVFIHPFANGNGRHARLLTDLLLIQHGGIRFSWGSTSLYSQKILYNSLEESGLRRICFVKQFCKKLI